MGKRGTASLSDILARLAYTSLFEKIVTTSISTTADYGEIVAVEGSSAPVLIMAPFLGAKSPKDAYHFAVVDADGGASTHTITINGNGKNISGSATAMISVAKGGAFLFFSLAANEWVIFETGSSAVSASPARAWADNGSATVTLTANTAVIGADVIITPATTGKLRVIISGVASNPGEVGADSTLVMSVSHGALATPADYTQSPAGPITVPSAEDIPFSLVVDLDAAGVTFPVGTPVQINAVCLAGNNHLLLNPHACQISVQEVT